MGRLRRAWLDDPSGPIEDFLVTQIADYGQRHAIAVDHHTDRAYWPDATYEAIQSAHADGTASRSTVVHDVSGPHGIAIDHSAGKVYWSDTIANTIERANLDGSNVEILVPEEVGLISPLGLCLDVAAGKMYWVDRGNSIKDGVGDRVMRANMADGKDLEDLVTEGHMEPRDIIVLPDEL
mmetsp:Transcript_52577/g.138734  ORF Transcript_52577/g.138734 Transcript_52577/m.138734 type:complete len:180 (+) Transcript_52577:2-541(+)